MEDATREFVLKGRQHLEQFVMSGAHVNDEGELKTDAPLGLSAQHFHLFCSARSIPIQIYAHFANGDERIALDHEHTLHLVE